MNIFPVAAVIHAMKTAAIGKYEKEYILHGDMLGAMQNVAITKAENNTERGAPMTKTSIYDLPFTQSEAPIKEGDAVLIIRPDGEIVPLTVGIDQEKVNKLRAKDPEKMTSDEVDLLYQGNILFLLSMAASSEAVMELLARLSNVPGEIDTNHLLAATTVH